MAPENPQISLSASIWRNQSEDCRIYARYRQLNSIALPTRLEAGPQAVVDDMCAAIRELIAQFSKTHQLAGVGVGSPGPLELPAGRLHHPPNLPGWDGFHLLAEMEKRLRMPVAVESDANLAALAEYTLGLGRDLGVESLCMLTLGTGVGNGIVLDGKLWHGATGMGGEAGHMTIEPEDPVCGRGNRGCLEVCASATALVSAAERLIAAGNAPGLAELKDGRASLTALDLAQAARQGDPDAQDVYARTGRALGMGWPVSSTFSTCRSTWLEGESPNRGTSLRLLCSMNSSAQLCLPAHRARPCCLGRNARRGTQVLPARLGTEAGLLGACLLPLHLSRTALATQAPLSAPGQRASLQPL